MPAPAWPSPRKDKPHDGGRARGGAEWTPSFATRLAQSACIGCGRYWPNNSYSDAPAGKMRSLSEVPALVGQGEAICAALRRQVEKLGLSIGDEPLWAGLSFAETVDPFSQEVSLVGTWRGGQRFGTVTFFADGRIFAEYQVLLPHPAKAEYYVEAVQVWGAPEQLRGDAVIAEYAR